MEEENRNHVANALKFYSKYKASFLHLLNLFNF